jgi:hypothetical protein
MYNLTVALAHTFFVGEGEWLVHNESLCNPKEVRARAKEYAQEVIDKYSKNPDARPHTIAILQLKDGTIFVAFSGEGLEVPQFIKNIIGKNNRHPFNFKCAEMGCIVKAMAGKNITQLSGAIKTLSGSIITTVQLRGGADNPMFHAPCSPTGCGTVLKKLEINTIQPK